MGTYCGSGWTGRATGRWGGGGGGPRGAQGTAASLPGDTGSRSGSHTQLLWLLPTPAQGPCLRGGSGGCAGPWCHTLIITSLSWGGGGHPDTGTTGDTVAVATLRRREKKDAQGTKLSCNSTKTFKCLKTFVFFFVFFKLYVPISQRFQTCRLENLKLTKQIINVDTVNLVF